MKILFNHHLIVIQHFALATNQKNNYIPVFKCTMYKLVSPLINWLLIGLPG